MKRVLILCLSLLIGNLVNVYGNTPNQLVDHVATDSNNEIKYSSIEGDWVRISYNRYYGTTMNIEKFNDSNTFQGTLTSVSKKVLEDAEFNIGQINITNIIKNSDSKYIGEILSTNGERSKFIITVDPELKILEMKAMDNYSSITKGDYQKWIRLTNDFDINTMQTLADDIFIISLANFPYIAVNEDIIRYNQKFYTKEKGNEIIDKYVTLLFERKILVKERDKLNKTILKLNKDIDIKQTKLMLASTQLYKDSLNNELKKMREEVKSLQAQAVELNKSITSKLKEESSAEEDYAKMIRIYKL